MEPIVVRVDSRIRLPVAGLSEDIVVALRKSCEHDNPDFSKRMAMGYSTYQTPAKIRTWRLEGGVLSLPRGAMKRLRQHLRERNVAYKVRDERTEGSILRRELPYIGHSLRPYQADAVDSALAKEQGIIRAATGTGKTTTMLNLASRVGFNTLVILPSVKLLDQTVEVAESLLGLRGDQIGVVQANKRRLRPLTVATQQTLWARGVDEELQEYFGAVCVDEAHHAAARTFGESIDQFPARYRFAFSADERRKDRKEFLVYDAFGEVLHETTREQAEETGAVVDVEIRLVPTDFRADWYAKDQDFDRLIREMTADTERNALAVRFAAEEVEAGEQVIMLTHRREHAHQLELELARRSVKCGRMLGGEGHDKQVFEATRAGLRDGSVHAGIGTYEALGEGIDLPAVAVGVATTPILSNRQRTNQVRGRLCRPSAGKEQGRLYVLFDVHVFDERTLSNVLAWNRNVKVLHRGQWVDARTHRRVIMAA